MKIFPNPTGEKVYIQGLPLGLLVTVKIIDAQGKCVCKQSGKSEEIFPLNVSALESGSYVLSLAGERYSIHKKLIVFSE